MNKTKAMDSISEGMVNFIKLCENILKKLEAHEKILEGELEMQLLNVVGYNIDDVIAYVSKCKADTLANPRVKQFLKHCEDIRRKLGPYKEPSNSKNVQNIAKILCSGSSTSSGSYGKKPLTPSAPETSKDHKKVTITDEAGKSKISTSDKETSVSGDSLFANLPVMCNTCYGRKAEPIKFPCVTCYKNPSPCVSQESSKLTKPTPVTPQKETKKSKSPVLSNKNIPPKLKESLGYFENRTRQIVRVNRYRDADGTIKEETQMINFERKKHDPTETMMIEDDFNDTDALLDIDMISFTEELEKDQSTPASESNEIKTEIRYIK